jgi:hypothetical protein
MRRPGPLVGPAVGSAGRRWGRRPAEGAGRESQTRPLSDAVGDRSSVGNSRLLDRPHRERLPELAPIEEYLTCPAMRQRVIYRHEIRCCAFGQRALADACMRFRPVRSRASRKYPVYRRGRRNPHAHARRKLWSIGAIPNGRTVAFIHGDKQSDPENGENAVTSLWIADGIAGTAQKLIGPSSNTDPRLDFTSFGSPIFSLDGRYVYVSAAAWATSSAVHQVDVATGKQRFVIDGSAIAVIRTGKYRGYLLVHRHMYHPAPEFGSYDPVYVVRPDARESFPVPGSDKDDGEQSVDRWLRANGWEAW